MSSDKLSRKEVREPDPFVRVAASYWSKLMEHPKALVGVLGVVVVAFLAVAFTSHFAGKKADAAGGALSRAMETARRPVANSQEPTLDTELPKFNSYKEKNEELAKQLEQVRKDFAGTEAAATATLFLADAELQLGKLDEASGHYNDYLSATKPGEPLRALAYEGLGYAQEAKKAYDPAASAFEKMGQEAQGDSLRARAAYQRARVLEAQGKKQEAADAFQKLKDEFKDAPAAQDASERLALLAGQGIVPPLPAKSDAKDAKATK